jgi:hypothetical protein
METPVTITWVSGEGFLARDAAGVEGRGHSPRTAFEALEAAVAAKFAPIRAASLAQPPPGDPADPWAGFIGSWNTDDPLALAAQREWWEHVQEFRRQRALEDDLAGDGNPGVATG